ncbi:hypothetical protein GCM10011575_27890 [Microlunatus endophyticus]|uniref:DUF72 domain-containing protein n=1 Tax=Microlunatus endophyticus TaxID=1716077 RepID=A0A917SB07_9ACTN|nr:DUF72 domain-containing protein [Microlunatus endophyticus]GGL67784.1 hypothetical protein GCM10011575_27890 [Microlunatus endophyticus]
MIRVGISGWTYPPWRGTFYPKGLPHKQELAYAAERMNSIEINGTFYALQRPTSFALWREQVPDDFVFSVKGGRFITHMKKLRDPEQSLANFFASGVLGLGPKLGPLLWQLPPDLGYDPERLADFFTALPRTHAQAAALGARHDDRLAEDRVFLTPELGDRPLQHALEVRHDSYKNPEFLGLLRDHDIAMVVADTAGKWPQIEELTTEFCYIRLHGADQLYVSGYTEKGLDEWADKIRNWSAEVRDVYVYFDNDTKVRSPYDAMSLARRFQEL